MTATVRIPTIISLLLLASPAAAEEAPDAPPAAPSAVEAEAAPPQPAAAQAPVEPLPRFDLDAALADGGRALSADEAVGLALARAPGVERARAAVEAARHGETEALVTLIPRLELSARYFRIGGFEDGSISVGLDTLPEEAGQLASQVQDPAAMLLLTGMVENLSSLGNVEFSVPRNQIGLRASLTFPLSDLFLTLMPAYRAAEAQTALEEHRLEASEADVVLAASEAYYRYAGARGGLEVARASVALAEEHLERVRALYRADLAVEADLAQAEAYVAAARSGVARAGAGAAVAEAALETLLGVDAPEGFAVAERLTEAGAPPAELTSDVLEQAYASRPEIRALEGLLEVQRHGERAASGAYWPHLALVAGADYASPNPRVIPPDDEFTPSWEVGAVLSWSPSDTARASAAVRRVRAMRAAAEGDLAGLRDGVRLQAVRAREELIAAQAVSAASLARVEAAERSYESRRAALDAGEGVPTDVLDADIEVTRARLELLRAGVDARIAEARLCHALGQLAAE